MAGVLRFSLVLCDGSAGPGRGVVRLLSDSSSEASWDCELDSSDLDSGEPRSGAIWVWVGDRVGHFGGAERDGLGTTQTLPLCRCSEVILVSALTGNPHRESIEMSRRPG